MKIKAILVIGFGSIAKKHVITLKKIDKNIKILKLKIKDKKISFQKINKLIEKFKLKAALICSPANTHLNYINFLKEKKINYLVEKPVIKDDQLKLFSKTYDKKIGITEIVGYQLRYNKIIVKIKKILLSKTLGKINNVKIFVNSYLPYWRTKNFKNSLSLSQKLGGGALLELSHEIDYMLWLFGKPNYLKASIDKNRSFKNDIDEKVCVFLYYSKFSIQLDMSFNSRIEERGIIINASKASIKGDLLKNKIIINKFNNPKILFQTKQNNMDMLYEQMKFFLHSVEQNKKINYIFRSLEIIKLISLIKKSNLSNKRIRI